MECFDAESFALVRLTPAHCKIGQNGGYDNTCSVEISASVANRGNIEDIRGKGNGLLMPSVTHLNPSRIGV